MAQVHSITQAFSLAGHGWLLSTFGQLIVGEYILQYFRNQAPKKSETILQTD